MRNSRFADPAVLVPVIMAMWARRWSDAWPEGDAASREIVGAVVTTIASADAMEALSEDDQLPVLLALDAAWQATREAMTARMAAFGIPPARAELLTRLAQAEHNLNASALVRRIAPRADPDTDADAPV
ncbi:hypothetical protein [Actinomadura harenae]|uniref:Uncharacterized protein n=1 Tax=Actinomadura harenae TaxID=2483351 RepID=A0A3M2LPN3_9ACTN|nr:hypothetical protein [Actinomadura harenae]RMI39046.1 hypothetical protein EBO15_30755 [Actinomadura harenae]